MRIIKNNIIPVKGFIACNICGMLFVRKELAHKLTDRVINHERIHTRQMAELLVIGFYVVYVTEWLYHLLRTGDCKKAYHAISFEREARENEINPSYLDNRRMYAQWGL